MVRRQRSRRAPHATGCLYSFATEDRVQRSTAFQRGEQRGSVAKLFLYGHRFQTVGSQLTRQQARHVLDPQALARQATKAAPFRVQPRGQPAIALCRAEMAHGSAHQQPAPRPQHAQHLTPGRRLEPMPRKIRNHHIERTPGIGQRLGSRMAQRNPRQHGLARRAREHGRRHIHALPRDAGKRLQQPLGRKAGATTKVEAASPKKRPSARNQTPQQRLIEEAVLSRVVAPSPLVIGPWADPHVTLGRLRLAYDIRAHGG